MCKSNNNCLLNASLLNVLTATVTHSMIGNSAHSFTSPPLARELPISSLVFVPEHLAWTRARELAGATPPSSLEAGKTLQALLKADGSGLFTLLNLVALLFEEHLGHMTAIVAFDW